MSASRLQLKGVARVIPDVCTFVTPVFNDEAGGNFIQEITDGRTVNFRPIALAEEFVPIKVSMSLMIEEDAVYAFESSSGHYLLGTWARLAEELVTHWIPTITSAIADDPTVAAIHRFAAGSPAKQSTNALLVSVESANTEVQRTNTSMGESKPAASGTPVESRRSRLAWLNSRRTNMSQGCDRFAAFFAHLLNSEDSPVIRVSVGELYARVTDALASRYAQTLLQYSSYASRMSVEEASERYWVTILQRRLPAGHRTELSSGHRLLEALCKRGIETGWPTSTLQREAQPTPAGSLPLPTSASFATCAQRLAEVPAHVSRASDTSRARTRPIVLRMDGQCAVVPEEMSILDAILCAPEAQWALPPGAAFNKFCGIMIDCIRTVHRPFAELVGLGVCPFDWLDVLSIQQTRALSRFLSTLRSDSRADWDIAWEQSPVPGFATAATLRESDIGLALRAASSATVFEQLDAPSDQSDSSVLSDESFLQQLDLLRGDQIIDANERNLLIALYNGAEWDELLAMPAVKKILHTQGVKLEHVLHSLEQRIHRWADENATDVLLPWTQG